MDMNGIKMCSLEDKKIKRINKKNGVIDLWLYEVYRSNSKNIHKLEECWESKTTQERIIEKKKKIIRREKK